MSSTAQRHGEVRQAHANDTGLVDHGGNGLHALTNELVSLAERLDAFLVTSFPIRLFSKGSRHGKGCSASEGDSIA